MSIAFLVGRAVAEESRREGRQPYYPTKMRAPADVAVSDWVFLEAHPVEEWLAGYEAGLSSPVIINTDNEPTVKEIP